MFTHVEKPDFGTFGAYKEEDWDRYEILREGTELGVTTLKNLAGARFAQANLNDDGTRGADGLFILAPDAALVSAAADGGDINNSSYVILYRSAGGRILIPGDADDATWEYVLKHYPDDVKGCAVFCPR